MPKMTVSTGKPKNFKKAMGQFIGFIKPYRIGIVLAIIAALCGAILSLIGPNLLQKISNLILDPINSFKQAIENGESEYAGTFDLHYILAVGGFLVGLYVVSMLFKFIQGCIMNTITQKVSQKLRNSISVKINHLPLDYFDRTATGDILSRVTNDVDTIASTLNNNLVTLFSSLALLVGSVVMMFVKNPLLALVAIFSSLIGFSAMGIIIKNSQKYFLMEQRNLGALNGNIEEVYSGHNVIGVFNAKHQVNQAFDQLNAKLYQSAWKNQFFSGLMGPLMGFIGDLGFVAVCVVGGILAFSNTIDFGTIVAFIVYIRLFTQPLRQLAQSATSFQSAAAASERVFEFLSEQEMSAENHKTALLTDVKGNITFDHVSFGYRPGQNIINDFSTKVKAGQKIAIVGPTGAGKTTIVNLLMRFYEVNQGRILIDGQDIADVKRENVHDLFGMVLQDTWLFGGTIYENIIYNLPNVTKAEVEEACIATGLHHFVKTLPNGYDTILNENNSLSAGQRQLLTIARAMIKNAPLLILDEATSNVDTRTELLITNAMDKLMRGRTSFIIAHRLSTILNADNILVMKDGEIVENGTHKQLLAKKGFYADLYNSQFETV